MGDSRVTERMKQQTFVGYAVREDVTVVDAAGLGSSDGHVYRDSSSQAVLTHDMVEQLRSKLRQAEAREGSGVYRRTPENGLERATAVEHPVATLPEVPDAVVVTLVPEPAPMPVEVDADVRVEVEPPVQLAVVQPLALEPVALDAAQVAIEPTPVDPLEEVLAAVATVEVALAPNSESCFYAGFDDEHPDGVFAATYDLHPVGTPVYLDVVLPAGFGFRVAAVVEWVRPVEASTDGLPTGVGYRMCGLEQSQRRQIRSFCRHRRPLFFA